MLTPYDPSLDYTIKLVFDNSDDAFMWFLSTGHYFPHQSRCTWIGTDGTLWMDVQ